MKNKEKLYGAAPSLMMAFSMAIFGTLAPFVRNISVSSGELALYRAMLASFLIFIYLLITKRKIDLRTIKKEVLLLLASGAAMGINWILLFEAYKYTTVSLATLSYYFAPVIVIALCPVFFKEKMTRLGVLCFIMSTLGLVLITGIGTTGGKDLIGVLLGLGAALLYATVIITNKFITTVGGIHRTLLQFLSAILVLLPYVLLTGGMHISNLDGKGWICLLVVGFVHTGITYCMYFSSLGRIPGQQLAILSYIDPLVAVFVSVAFLGESMTAPQVAGGVLILGFTLLYELLGQKRK